MLRTESERISIHNTTLDNKNLVVISFIVKLFYQIWSLKSLSQLTLSLSSKTLSWIISECYSQIKSEGCVCIQAFDMQNKRAADASSNALQRNMKVAMKRKLRQRQKRWCEGAPSSWYVQGMSGVWEQRREHERTFITSVSVQEENSSLTGRQNLCLVYVWQKRKTETNFSTSSKHNSLKHNAALLRS